MICGSNAQILEPKLDQVRRFFAVSKATPEVFHIFHLFVFVVGICPVSMSWSLWGWHVVRLQQRRHRNPTMFDGCT